MTDVATVGTAFCAAVDWGTSSFRLWLLDRAGAVLGERRSYEGLGVSADAGFGVVLDRHLDALDADPHLPVVICGMAGSRQGWVEAPYRETPCSLDQMTAGAVRVTGTDRDIRILPGLAQRKSEAADVMRGEETILAGLMSDAPDRFLACLPGTHAKWATIENRTVTGFVTFMTGELFAILAKHSILRHTMADVDATFNEPAFREAVRAGYERPGEWTASLFALRAGPLLDLSDPGETGDRLSGLLIGAEIGAMKARISPSDSNIILVASEGIGTRYAAALDACNLTFSTVDAEDAARRGLCEAACALWTSEA